MEPWNEPKDEPKIEKVEPKEIKEEPKEEIKKEKVKKEKPKKQKANVMDEYVKRQITTAKVFFIILTISIIICIAGAVYTIADMFMPRGKAEQFSQLGLGLQMAIIGGLFAGLFILLVMFYALYKKGNQRILKILFKKKREVIDIYQGKMGVKIIAVGVLVSICVIMIGVLYSLVDIFILSSTTGGITEFIASLSQGQQILMIGLLCVSLIVLVLLFKYFIDHGYYLILKLFYNIEDKE